MKVDTRAPNISKTCLTQLELNAISFKFTSLLFKFPELKFYGEEPIKRWFGVSGYRSAMPSLTAVRGLQFKTD